VLGTRPEDYRKRAEGLAALTREDINADPFSGAVFVFRAKRADRVKHDPRPALPRSGVQSAQQRKPSFTT
jgi:transposase